MAGVCLLGMTNAWPVRAQQSAGGGEPDTAAVQVYLDDTARRLMTGARALRTSTLSEIESYTALIRERRSVEASVLVRDRPIVRLESASRVRWSRDGPDVVRVLGSRAGLGRMRMRAPVPEGVAARLAADPLRDPFSLLLVSDFGPDMDKSWLVPTVTPLDEDAERFYQFSSGDTISVLLPGGSSVRAVSVTAAPRSRHLGLVVAVMWIEPESFGIVRVIYRPAKATDSEVRLRVGSEFSMGLGVVVQGRSLGDIDAPSPPRPGVLNRILNYALDGIYGQMESVTPVVVADYALWNLRYWLPRRASFVSYVHTGDEMDAAYGERVTVAGHHDWDFEVENIATLEGDSTGQPALTTEELIRAWREDGDTVRVKGESETDSSTIVIASQDWRALSESDLLPPSIWEERERDVYAAEIDEAEEVLDSIGIAGLTPGTPTDAAVSPWFFEPPILAPALLRYNPVEGLSVGTRLLREFPWGRGALTLRTATRRAEPDVDLALEHGQSAPRVRLSVYRSLRANGSTVTGRRPHRLEFGTDSTWYQVAQGAALQFLPARSDRSWTSLRLFAETTTPLGRDTRRRVGVDAYWRPSWGGYTGRRVHGGADVSVQGIVGDYPSVRLSAMGRLVVPLAAGLSAALEAGGANIWGDPAPEEVWRVGASAEWLRGYPYVVLRGRKIWRSRAELQLAASLFQFSLFHDWASVDGTGLESVGVGVSLLNGFLRLDLSRPRSPWYEEGVDRAHQPEWEAQLRSLAPF